MVTVDLDRTGRPRVRVGMLEDLSRADLSYLELGALEYCPCACGLTLREVDWLDLEWPWGDIARQIGFRGLAANDHSPARISAARQARLATYHRADEVTQETRVDDVEVDFEMLDEDGATIPASQLSQVGPATVTYRAPLGPVVTYPYPLPSWVKKP